MNNTNVKKKVFSGLIWKFGERIAAQGVTFIVSIILARILSPFDYGAIAIVNIFITLANVFVDSGMGVSLIQKKDADNIDFSSVFYFNIAMSLGMYAIVFFVAPIIADFYHIEIISPVLRVLGLRLIVAAVNSIQHAYVSRKMMFKRFFWSTFIGTVVSAIVGIVMAYSGFGVWSLVAQYMVNTSMDTIVLWFTVKWRPILAFSVIRIKKLFSYGWKILASSLLSTGSNELRSLIIGKMYTPGDLAFYNKGKSFPDLVVNNIDKSIQSVLFPAISNVQDDSVTVKTMMRRSIRVSSYIMFPIMFGLALVSETFIELLLTDKWLDCVPYLQICCFVCAFMPIHTSNLQAIKAMGRSDIYLKLEILKKCVGIGLLLISMQFGVMAIAFSGLISTITSSFINAFPNKKLIGYGYGEQIKDLLNGILPLIAMAVFVWCLGLLNINAVLLLLIQASSGIVVYIAISYITKNESFNYIISLLKNMIKKPGK